jgi:carbonic anhydrase
MMMKHIFEGLRHFQEDVFIMKRALFQELEHEQHPKALFITCSDSRVDPTLMTQTQPGELFVLRNAGNIIPPHGCDMGIGQEATVDYALNHLGVEHIIICGHTDCGAVKALIEHPEEELSLPLRKWLRCAHEVREQALHNTLPHQCNDAELLPAIQHNVKLQLEHLATLPSVKQALEQQRIQLHGWVYCLNNAEVFTLNLETGEFVSFFSGPPGVKEASHSMEETGTLFREITSASSDVA